MSKKFIIGASIALALILGGGLGYYFWNQASADVVTKDFCTGTTGNGWKNCVANAVILRGELATRDSTKFARALKNADTLRNYVPGKNVVISPTASVGAAGTVFTFTSGGSPAKDSTVTATLYVPCLYTYYKSGLKNATAAATFDMTSKLDSTGTFTILDSYVKEQSKKVCPDKVAVDSSHIAALTPDANGDVISMSAWRVNFSKITDNFGNARTFVSNTKIKSENVFLIISISEVFSSLTAKVSAGYAGKNVTIDNLYSWNAKEHNTLTLTVQ